MFEGFRALGRPLGFQAEVRFEGFWLWGLGLRATLATHRWSTTASGYDGTMAVGAAAASATVAITIATSTTTTSLLLPCTVLSGWPGVRWGDLNALAIECVPGVSRSACADFSFDGTNMVIKLMQQRVYLRARHGPRPTKQRGTLSFEPQG